MSKKWAPTQQADVERVYKALSVRCAPPAGGGSHFKISHPSQREILTLPCPSPHQTRIHPQACAFPRRRERPRCDEEGGGFLTPAPDLLGCMSDGETHAEAAQNVEEAPALGRVIPSPAKRLRAVGRFEPLVRQSETNAATFCRPPPPHFPSPAALTSSSNPLTAPEPAPGRKETQT